MKKSLNAENIANELKGGSAFFPGYKREDAPLPQEQKPETKSMPTPPLAENIQAQTKESPLIKAETHISQEESNTYSNKETNKEDNIVSNITILQITEKDIDNLRELAEKPQTYRLTHKDIAYIQEVAYQLSKESKRGKISQGDILRIALLLFDKFMASNRKQLKEILEKIK